MYDVRHVLRKAGLRSTYSGYNYLASAVALVLKDQEFYMKNVTSNLYRVVGEQYAGRLYPGSFPSLIIRYCVEFMHYRISAWYTQNNISRPALNKVQPMRLHLVYRIGFL